MIISCPGWRSAASARCRERGRSRLTKALYEACATKDYERARPLQHRLSHLLSVIKVNYPAGVKAAMAIMGRPAGPPRRPVAPLDRDAVERMSAVLDKLGVLAEEPHGW